jgi:hypothetical protein
MVCITDHKTTVSYIWLTIVITHSFFSVCHVYVCVHACMCGILIVITVKCGSLLVSLEVKMKTYRYLNGHQLTVEKAADDRSCPFRSLALLETIHYSERKSLEYVHIDWNDFCKSVRSYNLYFSIPFALLDLVFIFMPSLQTFQNNYK